MSRTPRHGKPTPSQHTLKQALKYDPQSGKLYWKSRGISKSWDTKWAGNEAFTATSSTGYKCGRINGANYLAHRVIYKLVTGDEPIEIDHIDGVRDNNCWSNLRSVPLEDNRRNSRRSKRNTSGHTGVRYEPERSCWIARIRNNHLGCFSSVDDAIAARKQAERKYGFHPNHGR